MCEPHLDGITVRRRSQPNFATKSVKNGSGANPRMRSSLPSIADMMILVADPLLWNVDVRFALQRWTSLRQVKGSMWVPKGCAKLFLAGSSGEQAIGSFRPLLKCNRPCQHDAMGQRPSFEASALPT